MGENKSTRGGSAVERERPNYFEQRTAENSAEAARLLAIAQGRLDQIENPLSAPLSDALGQNTSLTFPHASRVAGLEDQRALMATLRLFSRNHWPPTEEERQKTEKRNGTYSKKGVEFEAHWLVTSTGDDLLILKSASKLNSSTAEDARHLLSKKIRVDGVQVETIITCLQSEETDPGHRILVCPAGICPMIEIFPDIKARKLSIHGPALAESDEPIEIKVEDARQAMDLTISLFTTKVYPEQYEDWHSHFDSQPVTGQGGVADADSGQTEG